MPLTGYNLTWGPLLANTMIFPRGNPAFATGKFSFAQSIANGLTFGFIGSQITTVDGGTAPLNPLIGGTGIGVGLFGFAVPIFSSTFTSLCLAKFQSFTIENSTIMNAIATTFTTALAQASIITTHPAVANGTGVAKLIPPSPQTLTGILYANAIPPVNSNPVYSRWYDYSSIIALSTIAGCAAVTGTVQISGAPIAPPVAVVGAAGTGVVS